MPVYFEYLFKVSLSITIVFLFYTLLLRRITYYTCNRYYLLILSIISFVVPFIDISWFVQSPDNYLVLSDRLPSLTGTVTDNRLALDLMTKYEGITYIQLIAAVYIIGLLVLVLRFVTQLLSVEKIRSAATLRRKEGRLNIYHLNEPVMPFSFFNSIFVNHCNYTHNELEDIIDHEKVHAEQKHTWDVLIIEVICIINWCNPFSWLIRKAARENLEYIADNQVIKKGVDRKNYQYLLLKASGNIPTSVTSNLKFTSLKNRILMMNKSRSSGLQLLKFMLLVPVAVLVLLAFRNSKTKQETRETKTEQAENYTLTALTYSIPDAKVKAIVLNGQDKSLLKPGQLLNLTLVYNERNRLQKVLEQNGYRNLKNNSIRFFIDTASVNRSFSVEIHIDTEAAVVADAQHDSKVKATNHVIFSVRKTPVPDNLETPDSKPKESTPFFTDYYKTPKKGAKC